jgi:hypothetical protein
MDQPTLSAALLSLHMVGGYQCPAQVGLPITADRLSGHIVASFPSHVTVVSEGQGRPVLVTILLSKVTVGPGLSSFLTGFPIEGISEDVIQLVRSTSDSASSAVIRLACVRLLGAAAKDAHQVKSDCLRGLIASLVPLALRPTHHRGSSLQDRLTTSAGNLAAMESRIAQLQLASALVSAGRPQLYPRRNSRQLPTKSGSADRALRKAMEEGGYTFADIRTLRDIFLQHDRDGDGELSEADFFASMEADGSNDAAANARMFAAMKRRSGSNVKVSFIDFVKFRTKQKLLKSGAIHDTDAHVGFTCAVCGESPIYGERYCNANKADYSVCGKCYASTVTGQQKKHPELYYRVRVPFPPRSMCPPGFRDTVYPVGDDSLPLLPNLYASSKSSKNKKHGVNCSVCAKEILGCRFVDVHNLAVSLCTACDAASGDLTRVHLLVEVPLPSSALSPNMSPLLPPLPTESEPDALTSIRTLYLLLTSIR